MSTPDDVRAALAILTAARWRYAPDVDDATVVVWFDRLRQFEASELVQAARIIVANGDHFPSVGEFAIAAGGIRRRAEEAEPRRRLASGDPIWPAECVHDRITALRNNVAEAAASRGQQRKIRRKGNQ